MEIGPAGSLGLNNKQQSKVKKLPREPSRFNNEFIFTTGLSLTFGKGVSPFFDCDKSKRMGPAGPNKQLGTPNRGLEFTFRGKK